MPTREWTSSVLRLVEHLMRTQKVWGSGETVVNMPKPMHSGVAVRCRCRCRCVAGWFVVVVCIGCVSWLCACCVAHVCVLILRTVLCCVCDENAALCCVVLFSVLSCCRVVVWRVTWFGTLKNPPCLNSTCARVAGTEGDV